MIDTRDHPRYNYLFNDVLTQASIGLDVSFERSYLKHHKAYKDQCVWTGAYFNIPEYHIPEYEMRVSRKLALEILEEVIRITTL